MDDHLLFDLIVLLSVLNLLGLLRELQLSHEVLLALLEILVLILHLLDRTKAQLGKLEGSLSSAFAMSSIHSIGPVLDVAPEVGGVACEGATAARGNAVGVGPDMAIKEDGSDVGGRREQREDVLDIIDAGVSVVSPALDDNASEEHAVGGTDAREPGLEGVGGGEVEGLSVQKLNSFGCDGLVEAQNDRLKSGAVALVLIVTLNLEAVTAPASVILLHGAAVDLTAIVLAGKAEIPGRLNEAFLVDHEANLKWQLHDAEGNILDLLSLLLALLGSLLLLLSLELFLDRVRWRSSLCIGIDYLVGSELVVGARVRLDLCSVELSLGDMVV